MRLSLCKSPFIRDMNLETRALIDDECSGKQTASHKSCVGSMTNLDHMFMYHADSDELNPNGDCEWTILAKMLLAVTCRAGRIKRRF